MPIIFVSPEQVEYAFLVLSAGDGSRKVYSYLTSYQVDGQYWGCDKARYPEYMPFGSGWRTEQQGREELFAWCEENGYTRK